MAPELVVGNNAREPIVRDLYFPQYIEQWKTDVFTQKDIQHFRVLKQIRLLLPAINNIFDYAIHGTREWDIDCL